MCGDERPFGLPDPGDTLSVNEKFLIVNSKNRKFPIFVYMHKFSEKYMVKILA